MISPANYDQVLDSSTYVQLSLVEKTKISGSEVTAGSYRRFLVTFQKRMKVGLSFFCAFPIISDSFGR